MSDFQLEIGESHLHGKRVWKPVFIHRVRVLWVWILFLVSISHPLSAQETNTDTTATISAAELEWQVEQIAEGVIWKKYQGDDLYNARLSINLIELDLQNTHNLLKLAYSDSGLMNTSEFAKVHDAIAAINGSFFDMERGLPVVFIKADGETISRGAPGRNVYTENGGIGWNPGELPVIVTRPDDGWANTGYQNLLASGPMLIQESRMREFNNDPFHQNRHPRTAVAITGDQKMLLVTVDGRSFQSYGLTIPEIAQFFTELGATDALNLDGGGSSVMWIDDRIENGGVISYPSDNFEFDHEGERAVSTALLILRKRK